MPPSTRHRRGESSSFAVLPVNGAVSQLGRGERRKLDAIARVLRAHGRTGVYAVKVISVPQAWTGLHERAVLLISLPTLRLVTSEELAALVAHEIGHEYVWQQYADAKARRDTRRLRELELMCDAIAVRTLVGVGMRPERLQTAIEKTSWYNRERLGVALNEGEYPSLKERSRLIKQMSCLSDDVSPSGPADQCGRTVIESFGALSALNGVDKKSKRRQKLIHSEL